MPVEPDRTPDEGYHFTEDMTDRAIEWVRQQKALMPDKPFFVYYAPGATHAPHHVPTEWSDKYKGKFDDGWDAQRERTFARQKELGVIPQDAELTARPAEIPAWDEMPDDLKPVLARQMEVYAGFMEHTDHHAGRLIDALAELGHARRHARLRDHRRQRRIGRGHAAAARFNELLVLNGAAALETTEFMASQDRLSSGRPRPTTTTRWAGRTRWTRRTSGPSRSPRHWGGTRNGTIVRWPNGIKAKGEVRNQFHHVIDVAPTVLEAAGIPAPTFVNGIQQAPLEGVVDDLHVR